MRDLVRPARPNAESTNFLMAKIAKMRFVKRFRTKRDGRNANVSEEGRGIVDECKEGRGGEGRRGEERRMGK